MRRTQNAAGGAGQQQQSDAGRGGTAPRLGLLRHSRRFQSERKRDSGEENVRKGQMGVGGG